MSGSINRRCIHGLTLLLGLWAAAPAVASDVIIRVYATHLDKYAAALQPLSVQRTDWFHVTVSTFFGPVEIPFYCTVTASIRNVHFTIAPGAASVHGDISGSVCGIAYTSSINAPISISVDASTSLLVIRPVGPTNINATVTVLGVPFTVPFTNVSLGPSLTESSISLDVTQVNIESPSGARALVLGARNHQVSLQNGYFGIQADANFR